jgi:hypothetical protein
MKPKILLLQFILVLFAACSAGLEFSIGVDSITDPSAKPSHTYFLFPGDSTISIADLNFKEYCSFLRTILNSRDYKQSDLDKAELIIFVRYGIGNPSPHSYSYSIPIIERTDPGSTTTRSSSSTYGTVGNTSVSANTNTTSTVESKPKYDVVGTNTYSGTYTTYFRYFVIDAIDLNDFRKSGALNTAWRTTITSEGSSNDLRLVIPAMLTASINYIGINTGKRIDLEIDGNDARIDKLRHGSVSK